MSDSELEFNYVGTPLSLSAQITVAAVVLIFVLFMVTFIVYLKAKGYSGTTGSFSTRSRFSFATHESTLPRLALDPSILKFLPITIFSSKEYGEEDDMCDECAVCICELTDGEQVRFLPECKHGFHVECIDMWFHSNNTCPLCRNLVTAVEKSVETTIEISGVVLETGTSASSTSKNRKEGRLKIDIPKPTMNGISLSKTPLPSSCKIPSNSPLPTSRLLEEITSPIGRMKSFKRMMSKVSFKGVGSASSSYSPDGYDIEQGPLVDLKCQ